MVLVLILILIAGISAIINALIGAKHGMRYSDMIIIGILLTPLMTLYICLQAAAMDRRRS